MKELSESTVLIVDDTDANIDILVEALEDEYDIAVAKDGNRALEMVEANPPDLILLDVMMPGISGFETCRKIKQNEMNKDIPVIFITGKTEMESVVEGFNAGGVDYVTKPFRPEEVCARVKTHLHLRHLKKEMALKNKELEKKNDFMERELVVAREIQMSMLPTNFPPYPDHKELSLYAKLEPAREVGGDFYDFFFMGEGQFGVCVGDVSGKGAPSALFMAATKALIKSISENKVSPATILSYTNNELSRENASCMFVTIFLAVLDLKSGQFTYTNAGHNPPYIKRVNGGLSRLDKRHGPVVGAMDGINFGEDKDKLSKGDQLFLFTDGVTEAFDINGALFSDERLENLLGSRKYESAEKMVGSIYSEVKKFEDGAGQADDITILSLQYEG